MLFCCAHAMPPVPAVLQELLPPLWRTEMPLVRVIVDMEAAGLAINEAILNTGKPALVLSGQRGDAGERAGHRKAA